MGIILYDTRLSDSGGVVLIKETETGQNPEEMDRPEKIAGMMNRCLRLNERAEESCYMLALDSGCKALGLFFLSKGTVNASLMCPREIYIRALLSGAVHIILCHNHPSGNALPSNEDIRLTKRIKEAGELVGICLLDHIIIGGGNDSYFSFREAELL